MFMDVFNQHEMHVVCFIDGRPGHEKQTFGIVRALQRKISVKVTKIKVARRSFFQTILGNVKLYLPACSMKSQGVVKPDLLIGTGSQTHLPLLLFKQKINTPAVTCMAPDFIYRSRFELCFVPVHDGFEQKGNIVNTIGPPNCSVDREKHKNDFGLILLGGIDEKSHKWNSTGLVEKIETIVSRESAMRWLISSSPRTPEDTIAMVEKLSSLFPNVTFHNFRDTEPGWVEKQYDNSSVVWVTADSVSMIFEALTAGCKVGVIPVDWKKKSNKFMQSITFLEDKGFILPFEKWAVQKGSWLQHEKLNEAQKCAEEILTRWFPKNSQ